MEIGEKASDGGALQGVGQSEQGKVGGKEEAGGEGEGVEKGFRRRVGKTQEWQVVWIGRRRQERLEIQRGAE